MDHPVVVHLWPEVVRALDDTRDLAAFATTCRAAREAVRTVHVPARTGTRVEREQAVRDAMDDISRTARRHLAPDRVYVAAELHGSGFELESLEVTTDDEEEAHLQLCRSRSLTWIAGWLRRDVGVYGAICAAGILLRRRETPLLQTGRFRTLIVASPPRPPHGAP